MTDRLRGKVALVTGGGQGIGRAACELFAAEGAAVAVVDLDGAAAEATAAAVTAAGGTATAHAADVSDAAAVRATVEAVAGTHGALHVLYNNAGVSFGGSTQDGDDAHWERCLAVNTMGPYHCVKAAAPHLAASGGGAVVNQASVAALVGIANLAAYSASKGAVVAMTRAMAVDLAPQGIRVNVICPGTVYTPMSEPLLLARGDGDRDKGLALTVTKYPLGRLGEPAEIAHLALFLASDDASFMTGQTVTADGGMTIW